MRAVRLHFSICAVLLACSALAAPASRPDTRRPEPTDIPAFELLPTGGLRREGSGWSCLSNVVAIAAGAHHNIALKADGTVVTWSNRGTWMTDVPPGLSGIVGIWAAINFSSMAIAKD